MRTALLVLAAVLPALPAPADPWLRRVEPILSAAERQRYTALSNEAERDAFRSALWPGKRISAEQYFDRVAYADAKFGSGEEGSGAHTDQGRVYLALGPPDSIVQIPSSRVLVPLEIWRYAHVEGAPVSSEIQLLFFQARGAGFPKLYSPQLHTIRALLVNNAGTRGTIPVNDEVSPQDLLNRVRLSPLELEAVDAAMSVARGVRGSGNSELLAQLSSPATMLGQGLQERVRSRVVLAPEDRTTWQTVQYRTPDRLPAIDISIAATVRDSVGIEVAGVESFRTQLDFPAPTRIAYKHRLYLLPGTWNVSIIADSQRTSFVLKVRLLQDSDAEAPAQWEDATAGVAVHYRASLDEDARWLSVGRQYLFLNNAARAQFCFEKAMRMRRSAAALLGYGRALAFRGDLDAARTYLLEALRLAPDSYEAVVALAAVTAKFQDSDQALAYYRQAQSLRPSAELEQAIRELSSTGR